MATLIWSMPEVCSPLAEVISPIMSVTRRTLSTISFIVAPASLTGLLPASTRSTDMPISVLFSLAAAAERWARLRTSVATTAKPRPCSPARVVGVLLDGRGHFFHRTGLLLGTARQILIAGGDFARGRGNHVGAAAHFGYDRDQALIDLLRRRQQLADFVVRLDADLLGKVAGGHAVGHAQCFAQRAGNAADQEKPIATPASRPPAIWLIDTILDASKRATAAVYSL